MIAPANMRKKLTHSTPRVPHKPAHVSGGNPEAAGLSCLRLIRVAEGALVPTWAGGDLSVTLIFGARWAGTCPPPHLAGTPSSEDHLELA